MFIYKNYVLASCLILSSRSPTYGRDSHISVSSFWCGVDCLMRLSIVNSVDFFCVAGSSVGLVHIATFTSARVGDVFCKCKTIIRGGRGNFYLHLANARRFLKVPVLLSLAFRRTKKSSEKTSYLKYKFLKFTKSILLAK